jgi:flagellar biosynthesis protein FlhG
LKTIAVASGKGGVGKTTLVANLGVALALCGQRVVLFDADLGLANLDVVLGIKADINIQHVLEGIVRMPECAVQGPAGVRVIMGSSGISTMLRLSRKRLAALLAQTSELADTTDFLIFDCASGADARVMTCLMAADEVILVTTYDPASIVDCYSTAKVLFRYRHDAQISVVVNEAPNEVSARRAYETIASAAQEFLQKPIGYLGFVTEDRGVAEVTRKRKPFVLARPDLTASGHVMRLASSLAGTGSTPVQAETPSTGASPEMREAA